MTIIPQHYSIDIQDSTARHLELLREHYELSDEELLAKALRITELHLAEQEARLQASGVGGFDED